VKKNLGLFGRSVSCEEEGNYIKAEPLYKRSLATSEKALGPNHRDVAIILSNLGGIYHPQGVYAKAEPLYKRSLEISEKAFGPNHPAVAVSLKVAATPNSSRRSANARS
jgi:tetratricopeptide (TPR) repeat protein